MAILFSFRQQATATAVRSTAQAATATTGRVRFMRTTRAARTTCTSTQTPWIGAATFGTMGLVFVQFASRIYCLTGKKQNKQ